MATAAFKGRNASTEFAATRSSLEPGSAGGRRDLVAQDLARYRSGNGKYRGGIGAEQVEAVDVGRGWKSFVALGAPFGSTPHICDAVPVARSQSARASRRARSVERHCQWGVPSCTKEKVSELAQKGAV